MCVRRRPGQVATTSHAALLLTLMTTLMARDVAAVPSHPGKWTSSTSTVNWQSTAVNMALLPGWLPNSHSRILWWNADDARPIAGGLWGWNPPNDQDVNSGQFPGLAPITMSDPPLHSDQPRNIFCAGQTMLPETGRLLITGGTALGEGGTRSAVIFNAAAQEAGSWLPLDSMAFRRWYSDNTLLPSGKVVTVTGSSFSHHALVGGLTSGGSATATLQRYAVSYDDVWESSVVPTTAANLPLLPFSDTGAADIGSSSMFIFGGKDAAGQPRSNAITIHRQRNVSPNVFASDYWFEWKQLDQSGNLGVPTRRSGAAVVALKNSGDILVIGGTSLSGVESEVWRGKITNDDITWTRLNNNTGPHTLPALHGASAIYASDVDRVFLFGGSSTSADIPTNKDVYSILLGEPESNNLHVTRLESTATGDLPGPRSYASLNWFKNPQEPVSGQPAHRKAMLFGGFTVNASAPYADTLTSMWIMGPTEVVWERVTPVGSKPTGRARHGAAVDPNSQWLIVSGGETAASTTSNELWAFDLTCALNDCDTDPSNHWEELEDLPLAVRGHCAITIGPEPAFPRHPEEFTPWESAGQQPPRQWRTLADSPHWQEWYSFGFAAPRLFGDPAGQDSLRVFYAGPEDPSSILNMSTTPPRWRQVGANIGDWRAGSAVMYRPGKVMKCGTRDTGGILPENIIGRTAIIDLKAQNPTWVVAADADSMIPRRNHNLVILPTGEVIVVGGARWGANDFSTDDNCVKLPEIWDPEAGPAGHWYRQTSTGTPLDASTVRRHYHSSAILLPDGRVLCAGGNADTAHQVKADIYSPYYLFDANGNARTRPVIQGAPARVSYGERFALQMGPNDTQIAKVSLVRPGATTHGFDQNQRFVPLVFSVMNQQVSGERRYLVTAPADSFDAPPGDYMLFALDASGTPAVARWIQVRNTNLDNTPPTAVSDLVKVCGHGDWAELQWSTPQSDPGGTIKTPIKAYVIGRSTNPMPTLQSVLASATTAYTPAPPLDPDASATAGTSVINLSVGNLHYFRIASRDFESGDGNWSLSNEIAFTAMDEGCGGSGGGGGCCLEDPLTAENSLTIGLEGGSASSSGEFMENTLFANVPPATTAADMLRLTHGPRWTADGARIRLSHSGAGATRFTGVWLRGIALSAGQSAFASDGNLTVGTLSEPLGVWQADGRDLATAIAAGRPFEGHPGDTLLVAFTDGTPGRLVLHTSGLQQVAAPQRTGIDLQCEIGGNWSTVAHVDPRTLAASSMVGVPSAARVRLLFLGDHRLHGISRFEPGTAAAEVAFEPAAITHSREGDLAAGLGAAGLRLQGGEHALVDFTVPAEQVVGIDWFLEARGEHETPAGSSVTTKEEAPAETLPQRFMLHQNRPNPFDHETLIAFELPERARVRLEVFDLAGRRVATLANGDRAPGRYATAWNRRGPNGRVPAGVYTCRMIAGGRELKRQMVVF